MLESKESELSSAKLERDELKNKVKGQKEVTEMGGARGGGLVKGFDSDYSALRLNYL